MALSSYSNLIAKKFECQLTIEKITQVQPPFVLKTTFPNSGDTKWTLECTVEIRDSRKYLVFNLSVSLQKKTEIAAVPCIYINRYMSFPLIPTTFKHESTIWNKSAVLDNCVHRDGCVTVNCEVREVTPTPALLEDPLPPNTFSQDFQKMLLSGNFSDVTIECSDQRELKAHRAVLAARSPVFAAMFSHDSLEARSGRIVVTDVTSEGMAAMLKFIYTGRTAFELLELAETIVAADKYDLPYLKATCERMLLAQVTVQNAATFLAATYGKHQLAHINQCLLQIITANVQEVIQSDEWVDLVHNHPQIIADLNEGRRRHLDDASDAGSSASDAKRRCLETRKDAT